MLQPHRRHLEAIVRDPEGRQVARCLIRRGRYVLGQDRKNEIVIDEGSVSSTHARLTVVSDDEFFIEDQESANGTYVDGAAAHTMTPVTLESRVQIGRCTLEFQRGGLPAAVFRHLPDGFLRTHRYNFGDVVVEGRTSTIYEAHDTTLNRAVAIKIMLPQSQANAMHVLRFVREAQITSQLQHNGILSPYELGLNEQSRLFYTTRFVEGESLRNVLDELAASNTEILRKHSLTSLLFAFQKACDVIAYAHSRSVVHSGLTADCITLGAYGEVMVVNWCTAEILPTEESHGKAAPRPVLAPPNDTVANLSASTPPELLDGDFSRITPAADIYSLGAILYQILTLRPPLMAEDEEDLRSQIFHGVIPTPLSVAPANLLHCGDGKLPATLAATAMKALNPDPAQRFTRVEELQRAVFSWQSRASIPPDRTRTAKAELMI